MYMSLGIRRRAALGAVLGLACPWSMAQFRLAPWTGPDPVSWLEGVDQNGRNWSLRSLTGQVVVLNFWATWCPPCVAELPSLQLLSESGASGLVVLTVNVKEGAQRVDRFMQSLDLNLPILFDRRGEWSRRLGISTLPTTLLISPAGRTTLSVQGEVNWAGPQAQEWIKGLRTSTTALW